MAVAPEVMAIAASEAMAETVAKTAMESTESSMESAEAAVKPPTAVEGSCRGRDRAASGRNCDRRRPGHPRKLVFDEPKSAETFRCGYVHTGDLGTMNEDGFVFIKGRLKDMIITGGQNVHAAEVEEILLGIPGVADCAVFGLPDEIWGERVAALIVKSPNAGDGLTVESIEAACRERLAGFKIPRTILIETDPLPRTPTGKVQKFLPVERFSGAG
jgi:acyl-CoA synthetase (AMP-forming)/AMP-acid ligase II